MDTWIKCQAENCIPDFLYDRTGLMDGLDKVEYNIYQIFYTFFLLIFF